MIVTDHLFMQPRPLRKAKCFELHCSQHLTRLKQILFGLFFVNKNNEVRPELTKFS